MSVKLLPLDNFLKSFGNAMHNRMDLSPYYGHWYQCACGGEHVMDSRTSLVLQGYWKVMAICPEDLTYFTNIKVQMFMMVKFKGFKSLCGTRINTAEDQQLLMAVVDQLK